MTQEDQDKIMKLLEKKGYNVSSQAAKFLDYLGRENDADLVKEIVGWYENKYLKTITGSDVMNFVSQREEWAKKNKK